MVPSLEGSVAVTAVVLVEEVNRRNRRPLHDVPSLVQLGNNQSTAPVLGLEIRAGGLDLILKIACHDCPLFLATRPS